MSMSGWSTPEDMGTWIGDQRRQLDELGRRVRVPSAKQIMGPGLGPWAVRLFDWNDDKTTYNGVFYSEVGALNTPDPTKAWVGTSWAIQDGRGTQEVTEIGTTEPVWRRTFSTAPGATPAFTDWVGEGVWVSYVPTVSSGTIGAATPSGRYSRVGDTFDFEAVFPLGAGFSFGSSTVFGGLPFLAETISGYAPNIKVEFVSQGFAGFPGFAILVPTGVQLYTLYVPGVGYPYHSVVNGAAAGGAPFNWKATDAITIGGSGLSIAA